MLRLPPFPPPWTAQEIDACFIVRDHNGQNLAYVYFKGRARSEIGDEIAHVRLSKADCREYQ